MHARAVAARERARLRPRREAQPRLARRVHRALRARLPAGGAHRPRARLARDAALELRRVQAPLRRADRAGAGRPRVGRRLRGQQGAPSPRDQLRGLPRPHPHQRQRPTTSTSPPTTNCCAAPSSRGCSTRSARCPTSATPPAFKHSAFAVGRPGRHAHAAAPRHADAAAHADRRAASAGASSRRCPARACTTTSTSTARSTSRRSTCSASPTPRR